MNTEDLLLKRNIVVTPEQVEIIKNVIAKGATDDELKLFIFDCQRRGVHPLDKMIYFVKRKGKDGEHIGTHQASIDYFRSTAEESGDYDGQDEPFFEGETQEGYPEIARVNIYRKGINRPFVGVAYWKEYYPGESLGFMWRKMPHVMLAKCAEVNGFRKAFPKKLSGLYISEELEQAYNNAPQSGKPKVQQPQSKSENQNKENSDLISEAQAKRFYAIAKGVGWEDSELKAWLLSEYQIDSTKKITKEKYEEICERVKVFPPEPKEQEEREPGIEG